nr:ribonuclease HI [Cryptococcus depauperatus CBS 7855]
MTEYDPDQNTRAPKLSYYAVAVGKVPGIYNTWQDAEDQVRKYPGSRYKKFNTRQEAVDFIAAYTVSLPPNNFSQQPGSMKSTLKEFRDAHFHVSSPPTRSVIESLPRHLQAVARKGYLFTETLPHHLIVYTDGSARGNGQVGSRAGAGVWWGNVGEAFNQNWAERVPGESQTNNRGELLAVIRAIERCPYPDLPLEIRCDSQYTISSMTLWLQKWMKNDFKNGKNETVINTDLIKHLLALLRRRGPASKIKFKYVPAHSGIEGNEQADKLARAGGALPAVMDNTQWLDPDQQIVDHD